jgi:hypothetical protein
MLLSLLVRRVDPAKTAVFLKFQLLRSILLIFGGGIIFLFARGAGQSDDVSHWLLPL